MEVARASASPWMLNPWKRILVGSKKRKANGRKERGAHCETIGILITRSRKIARRKLERVITALGRRLIKVSHFPRGAPATGRCLPPVLLHRVLSNKDLPPLENKPDPHGGYSVTERRSHDGQHGLIPWAKSGLSGLETPQLIPR